MQRVSSGIHPMLLIYVGPSMVSLIDLLFFKTRETECFKEPNFSKHFKILFHEIEGNGINECLNDRILSEYVLVHGSLPLAVNSGVRLQRLFLVDPLSCILRARLVYSVQQSPGRPDGGSAAESQHERRPQRPERRAGASSPSPRVLLRPLPCHRAQGEGAPQGGLVTPTRLCVRHDAVPSPGGGIQPPGRARAGQR